MTSPHSLIEEKKILRQSLKKIRADIPPDKRETFSSTISNSLFNLESIQSSETVFIYISYASEVVTHDTIKWLLNQGKRVFVPKIVASDKMVAQHFEHWDDLKPGALGILAPTKGAIVTDPVDVAITPGLGFTKEGHRIGFGAGYYDRWFASHTVHQKIAIAFEAQIVNELPTEKTDMPVDMIITEKRTIVPS